MYIPLYPGILKIFDFYSVENNRTNGEDAPNAQPAEDIGVGGSNHNQEFVMYVYYNN